MIGDIDEALRSLIRGEVGSDVDVVLDAPTKDWAARRNAPTVDVYLYDIREDLRRRERGWIDVRAEGVVIGRRPAPRFFKLSYLVTAWTQRPEDEHRLLSALLACFVKYEALPSDLVNGPIAATGLSVPMTVGLPPPEDRAFADVWSALGGELKPSLDVVVTAPLDIGVDFPAGPPVREGAIVDLSSMSSGAVDHHRQRQPQFWSSGAAEGGAGGNGNGATGAGGAAPGAARAGGGTAGTRAGAAVGAPAGGAAAQASGGAASGAGGGTSAEAAAGDGPRGSGTAAGADSPGGAGGPGKAGAPGIRITRRTRGPSS